MPHLRTAKDRDSRAELGWPQAERERKGKMIHIKS
jgi:hypothetical protein